MNVTLPIHLVTNYDTNVNIIENFDGILNYASGSINANRLRNIIKDEDLAGELNRFLIDFTISAYEVVANINGYDAETARVKNFFYVVKSNACVNLKCNIPYAKKGELENKLIEALDKLDSTRAIMFYQTDQDAFRVKYKKRVSNIDRPYKDCTLFVLTYIFEEDLAFIRQKELADDLAVYLEDETAFHYFNSRNTFNALCIQYNKVFLEESSRRRVNADNPILPTGNFNFIKDLNKNIGSIIADVWVKDTVFNNNTYFSLKTFGPKIEDMAHLITLKIDYPQIYDISSFGLGVFFYSYIYNNKPLADMVIEACKNDYPFIHLGEMIEYYKENMPSNYYMAPFFPIIKELSDSGLKRSLSAFLHNKFFEIWYLDPLYYISTFAGFNVSNPMQDFDDISVEVPIEDNSISRNGIKDFIKDAFGKGYILLASRNKYLYAKDYRYYGITDLDAVPIKYRVSYLLKDNKVQLDIETNTLVLRGEIYTNNKSCPNNITFWYRYKDMEGFFDYASKSINEIIPEGKLKNSYKVSNPF